MEVVYDGSHSITFYDYRNVTATRSLDSLTYNTWTTWHLIPTSAPFVKPYEVTLSMATIPASNKIVDLSEAMNGNLQYGRRTGDWEFIMDSQGAGMSSWDLYYTIRDAIHGKWVAVVLDDATGHTYTGRITISDFSVDSSYGKIKFTYNLGGRNTASISKVRDL